MSGTAKKWTVAKAFDGLPTPSDFKIVEEKISFNLKPGEILIEAVYLTVDPYMRGSAPAPGNTMIGEQIARVKVSNNPAFPEGCFVLAKTGWRSLSLISNTEESVVQGPMVRKLPDFGDLPVSLGLGCLGMPGLTAYFGLLERGKPKAGETVLVSGAAGAVGSVVGQIAKIKGCTVIGSAGSKDKCDWLKELGFDHVFNYKETNVDDALKKFAPKGIDLYFDNVGGEYTRSVLQNHIKFAGRVVVCGAISLYNEKSDMAPNLVRYIIYKQLDILGIIVFAFKDRAAEGVSQLLQWVKEGKIKYRETITDGFENMPQTFISLFKGANTGKALVKAPKPRDSDPQLSRPEQVVIFLLKTGHNRLNQHLCRKLGVVPSPVSLCPCGEAEQDTSHNIQDCRSLLTLRTETWYRPKTLEDTLHVPAEALRKNTNFQSRDGALSMTGQLPCWANIFLVVDP